MMNEKRIKSFLINGFSSPEEPQEEVAEEETVFEEEEIVEEVDNTLFERIESIEDELLKMRYILEDLKDREAPVQDLSGYLTTKELMKALTATVERQEVEISNKALIAALEQIAVMREDFFRLCQSMRERIGSMTPEDVLSSFEAYEVDMENILRDGGVYIGPFDYERLNTIHQRIVGVVDTSDSEKDGAIAERLSEGYKLGNKVLLKEKVSVYKYVAEQAAETEPAEESATEEAEAPEAAETADAEEETTCETISEDIESIEEEKE